MGIPFCNRNIVSDRGPRTTTNTTCGGNFGCGFDVIVVGAGLGLLVYLVKRALTSRNVTSSRVTEDFV